MDAAQKPAWLSKKLEALKVKDFSYEDLVGGLKNGKFKRIVVMTGAGISVSAGIPDYRSPNSGVWSQTKDLNLPSPQMISTLSYFIENPQPWYTVQKDFYQKLIAAKPTPTHFFLKLLQEKGLLHWDLT